MSTPRTLWTLTLMAALLVSHAACNETVKVGASSDDDNAPDDDNNDVVNNAPNNSPNNAPNNDSDDVPPECTSDDECPQDQICEEGRCVVGCRDNDDCLSGTICDMGECIECRSDDDCTIDFVCEDTACVEGCRDDEGCSEGTICNDGACAEGCRDDASCDEGDICQDDLCVTGCRDDAGCDEGAICQDNLCVTGCRDDAGCDEGAICVESACVEGCRDDAGCDETQLCLEQACRFRGVSCRQDSDCNEGDRCEVADNTCVADTPECLDDVNEPNNTPQTATILGEGRVAGLNVCPEDVDVFGFDVQAGEVLEVLLVFPATGVSPTVMFNDAPLVADDGTVEASLTAAEEGRVVMSVRAPTPEARLTYALDVRITPPQLCMDTTVYRDADMDGFGDNNDTELQCLEPDEEAEGFVRAGDDCGPNDPLRHPGAQEVCGDFVDDDCDGGDEDCPESRPSVEVPDWDCTGEPPSSVVAWARFDSGEGFFQDGGCFFFFEGAPSEFFVKRNVERANDDPSCESLNGCTCPSLNGWPSYDRRMYAFTTSGPLEDCAEISIRDHGGESQPVSNACRKYLYQMHFYDIPYSFVSSSLASLERRLELFSTVEIACVEDAPHRNLPFQSLIQATIQRNPGFIAR